MIIFINHTMYRIEHISSPSKYFALKEVLVYIRDINDTPAPLGGVIFLKDLIDEINQ